MTKQEYGTLLTDVLNSLRFVSQSTETVYLKVGNTYRALVSDLDSLKSEGAHSRPQKMLLLQRIKELSDCLAAQEASIRRENESGSSQKDVFEDLHGDLEALARHTRDLGEDSEAMELISLNALVVASKAGQAGRGFAAITTELQNASVAIKELCRSLGTFAQESRRQFQDLKNRQTESAGSEQENLEKFRSGMNDLMTKIEAQVQDLLSGLEALQVRRSEIKSPLFKIVVEIQNQDAIRQSIDHVILSLGELESVKAGTSAQETLDTLSFLEILPELSIQVLGEISQKIALNHGNFKSLVDQAEDLINNLEAEQKSFLHRALLSGDGSGLSTVFDGLQSLADGFLKFSEGTLREKRAAHQKTDVLRSKVTSLSDTLAAFDEILSRFRNIDVASRIQVARYKELSGMRDNAMEMSRITQKIQTDVSLTGLSSKKFTQAVHQFMEEDRTTFDSRMRRDTAFLEALKSSIHQLEGARDGLAAEVREEGVFTSGFLETFSKTKAELSKLQDLCGEIGKQQERFKELQTHIQKEKRQYLSQLGLESWELHSDKLKAMVERFTIFTHKQIAADLGNFQIQAGADSGDVTLF